MWYIITILAIIIIYCHIFAKKLEKEFDLVDNNKL